MHQYSKILFITSSLLLAAAILIIGNIFEQLSKPGLWFGFFWLLAINTLVFFLSYKLFGSNSEKLSNSSGIMWSVDGVLAASGLLSFVTVIYFLWDNVDGYFTSFYFWMVQLIILAAAGSIVALLSLSLKLAVSSSQSTIKKETLVKDAEIISNEVMKSSGDLKEEITDFTNMIRFKLPHPSRLDQGELQLFSNELKDLAQRLMLDEYDSASMEMDIKSLRTKLNLLVGNSN